MSVYRSGESITRKCLAAKTKQATPHSNNTNSAPISNLCANYIIFPLQNVVL